MEFRDLTDRPETKSGDSHELHSCRKSVGRPKARGVTGCVCGCRMATPVRKSDGCAMGSCQQSAIRAHTVSTGNGGSSRTALEFNQHHEKEKPRKCLNEPKWLVHGHLCCGF